MENHQHLIIASVLWCLAGASQAAEPAATPRVLDGTAIIKIFEGKTVSGAYANGAPVRESYLAGGHIDYWDSQRTTTGKWLVVNNLLCTFYDDNTMSGGCFRVEQQSANCFDYLVEASTAEEALKPTEKPRYTARAHIEGQTQTCPDELAV